ncbi:hypothetical protein BC830DRAFT_1113108 [Chytriomyces sp. MP71]|nr:hypothetical protein BC830DRAFT_1113108 [Chytriomyces sp. MP71]
MRLATNPFLALAIAFAPSSLLAATLDYDGGRIIIREGTIGRGRTQGGLNGSLLSTASLVLASPSSAATDPKFGCSPVRYPGTATGDWIALVQRGECSFVDKVRAMQESGASAVVVGDSATIDDGAEARNSGDSGDPSGDLRARNRAHNTRIPRGLVTMVAPPGADLDIAIPSYFISSRDYANMLRLAGAFDDADAVEAELIAAYGSLGSPSFDFVSLWFHALFPHAESDAAATKSWSSQVHTTPHPTVLITSSTFLHQLYLMGLFLCGPILASIVFHVSLWMYQLKQRWDSAATARFVKHMPLKTWSLEDILAYSSSKDPLNVSDNDRQLCSICLDEFLINDKLRCLPCRHLFHAECVDQWLISVISTCPLCKQNIQGPTRNPQVAERDDFVQNNVTSTENTQNDDEISNFSHPFRVNNENELDPLMETTADIQTESSRNSLAPESPSSSSGSVMRQRHAFGSPARERIFGIKSAEPLDSDEATEDDNASYGPEYDEAAVVPAGFW